MSRSRFHNEDLTDGHRTFDGRARDSARRLAMTRFRRVMTIASLSGVLAGAVMTAAQRTADVALRAAIETETVRGDVRGAIEQYKRIVDTYGNSDRGIAAQALLRLAEAYQKLGDAEANSVYERLLRQF